MRKFLLPVYIFESPLRGANVPVNVRVVLATLGIISAVLAGVFSAAILSGNSPPLILPLSLVAAAAALLMISCAWNFVLGLMKSPGRLTIETCHFVWKRFSGLNRKR